MPDLPPQARISAAIEKLERERDEALAGPWRHFDYTVGGKPEPLGESGMYEAVPTISMSINKADADLIVTLHRTIDIQLTMLKYAEAEISYLGDDFKPSRCDEPHAVAMALQLADAILGGES